MRIEEMHRIMLDRDGSGGSVPSVDRECYRQFMDMCEKNIENLIALAMAFKKERHDLSDCYCDLNSG